MEDMSSFLFDFDVEDIMASSIHMLSAYCPDEGCRTKLFFPKYDASVECSNCGQRHQQDALHDIAEVTNPKLAFEQSIRLLLFGNKTSKKGPESVKVLGFSNYECKILSPLLTRYGMEKETGKAQLLSIMGRPPIFDCSVFGNRAFLIDPDQLEVSGYGRDHTGSMIYLREMLEMICLANNNVETLVPIHADGDGHCLVHAVSRALIGRELFWHALRANLKKHFRDNLPRYKLMFSDFVDSKEWIDIIDECDPDYEPRDGEPMGLRNIHIFGLANILKRPIILLDSINGMQLFGDYTGVFLPGLISPDDCRGKDGVLNKPLCLAWSSNGHNHYIALVGIKRRPLPKIPGYMLPKAWGIPQTQLTNYIDLQDDNGCVIGGENCLGDAYIRRLVNSMETLFREKNGVNASLVADYNHHIYKSTGLVRVDPQLVVNETALSVCEKRLYTCMVCNALSVHTILSEWFLPDGNLYRQAYQIHDSLDETKTYTFPQHGVVCSYNNKLDRLEPDFSQCYLIKCNMCEDTKVRLVGSDGSTIYRNGDRTQTVAIGSICECGYKHFWDGQEYDNKPTVFPVYLQWNYEKKVEEVIWFQDESNPALNSNAYKIAEKLVQKHFPGAFGSEVLVQNVVAQILLKTRALNSGSGNDKNIEIDRGAAGDIEKPEPDDGAWDKFSENKTIMIGFSKNTLHKEELNKSMKEKDLQRKIEENAGQNQRRRPISEKPKPTNAISSSKATVYKEELDTSVKEKDLQRQIEENAGQTQRRRPISEQSKPTTGISPSKINPKQAKTTSAASSEKSTSPTTPVEPRKRPEKGPHRIRITTTDGQQMNLDLEPETTYRGFQELIAANFQVPLERQRLKVGFPPRPLLVPKDGDQQNILNDLRHGDNIRLEILTIPTQVKAPSTPSNNEILVPPTEASTVPLTEFLDKFDMITSSGLASPFGITDMWSYAQTVPHLFASGGAFYEQVKRSIPLTPNKHCTIPNLPGKVFRYNATEDILELCLEPRGHFPVSPGIEERIGARQSPSDLLDFAEDLISAGFPDISRHLGIDSSSQDALRKVIRSGGNSVQVDPKMKHSVMPFTGQGHSMSGLSANITGHSRLPILTNQDRFAGECSPTQGQENTVPMDTDEQTESGRIMHKPQNALFRRVGPGSRILAPEPDPEGVRHTSLTQPLQMAASLQRDSASTSLDMMSASIVGSNGNADNMEVESMPNSPLRNSTEKSTE